MRIGIDARFYGEAGPGRYVKNIIEHLENIDNENEYIIFLRKKVFDEICCETYKSEKSIPGQALKIIAIGSKIFNAKDEVEFTEEEKALLREVIEGNKVYLTGVTGAMLKLLS